MRKISFILPILFAVFSACAQINLHDKNLRWLEDFNTAGQSAVLLNNETGFVPLKDLQLKKTASINIGTVHGAVFDSIANKYMEVSSFSAHDTYGRRIDLNNLGEELKYYTMLIIQLTAGSLNDPGTLSFILENQKDKQLVLVGYGDERALAKLQDFTSPIIWNPFETPASAQYAAQLIFGGVPAIGKLEQTASLKYKQDDGFITHSSRLSYTVPEAAGINSQQLESAVDAVMAEAILQRATPGGVVLAAKGGKVFFNKAYGHYDYNDPQIDRVESIFDLASITKVAATTMAVMKLYEQEKLKLDTNVGAYISETRSTNKNNMQVRDLMLHQAGLVSYIPFYQNLEAGDYSRDSSELYNVKVADNYYLRKGYYESVMWPRMLHSRLSSPGRYVYSDLSMYFMKEIVERQAVQDLASYVQEEFYDPLGMYTAVFNPRFHFSRSRIVPTEKDNYFRKTLVQGFVHDQGAAMAGGVSGHAGLFSTANDLAILFQMLLNGGTYGGRQYFKPETVQLFTSRQSDVSRRGLGFDRWDPETSRKYPSEFASPQTYGHTGFTGTCVWADPQYNMIYVFLSNRVISGGSNKLAYMDIRSRIQDAVYKAIMVSGDESAGVR